MPWRYHYCGLETKVVEIKGVALKELFTVILCDECFVHMYVCTLCESSAQEAGRGHRIHWNCRQSIATTWVLGIEPRSSGRIVSAPNH